MTTNLDRIANVLKEFNYKYVGEFKGHKVWRRDDHIVQVPVNSSVLEREVVRRILHYARLSFDEIDQVLCQLFTRN